MIDVDNFKSINDKYGHLVGDTVLVAIAKQIGSACKRDNHEAVRYGGEEFTCIIFNKPERYVQDFAQKMIEDISALSWQHSTDAVTISIGIAHKDLSDTKHHLLLEQADSALYQAKRAGKNRLVCFKRAS